MRTSYLALLALAVPALAHAVDFQVVGKCEVSVASAPNLVAFANESVFEATTKVLDEKKVAFVPSKSGDEVLSIGGFNKAEEVSAEGIRHWGWRFLVDGAAPFDAVNVAEVPYGEGRHSVKWVYGYILLNDYSNETQCPKGSPAECADQCVEADCDFHESKASDCN
jgi:hypothetical protein